MESPSNKDNDNKKRKAIDEPDSSSSASASASSSSPPTQRKRFCNSPKAQEAIELLDTAEEKFKKFPEKVRLSIPLGEWTSDSMNGTTDKDFFLREFLSEHQPEIYKEFFPLGPDYDITVRVGEWVEFLDELERFKKIVLDCDARLKPCDETTKLFEDAYELAEQFRDSLSPFEKIFNMDPAALCAATIGTFDHLVELTYPTTIGFPVLHPAAPKSSSDVDGGVALSAFCDVSFVRAGKREGKFGWKIFCHGRKIFRINGDNTICDVWISQEENYHTVNFKTFGSSLMYADDLSGAKGKPHSNFISLRFSRNGTFAVALGF
jgi:hypothetical protein